MSGRWFRAASLDGPWSFATPELPKDFALIPPDHPAGDVLSLVPGTKQAQEAVIQGNIPQTARVERKKVAPTVTYRGEPEFKPIESTSMAYAVSEWGVSWDGKRDRTIDRGMYGFHALHRLYPTADGWLYLECHRDDELRALVGVVGRDELADDARYRPLQQSVCYRRNS